MKPIDLHLILMLNTMTILTKASLNLKLVIMSGYRDTEMYMV